MFWKIKYIVFKIKILTVLLLSRSFLKQINIHYLVIHCLHTVHLIPGKNYRGKNCMKNFCLDLREHATEIINYEKKEIMPLTKEEKKMHWRQKKCYISKKRFSTDDNNQKYHKVKAHGHYTGKYRGASHNICTLRYKIPK